MQAERIGVLGLGALFAGCFALGAVDCSSTGEGPDDAGSLDGFFTPEGDASSGDASATSLGVDGGDATVIPGSDASGSGNPDGGDSSVATEDGGTDASMMADANDASEPGSDASDAAQSGVDASDASLADAGVDSSSTADDASVTDAADAEGEDASDTSVPEAGEDAGEDAGFDAAALCSGFNLAGDAINGLTAVTSPAGVTLNIATTNPSDNPVPVADTVVVTVTTSPIGVMENVSIGYFTNVAATPVYVAMSLVPTSGGTNQEWQGSIPSGFTSGTDVSFWVVGNDYCKTMADAGSDYYSNGGGNYHYQTQ